MNNNDQKAIASAEMRIESPDEDAMEPENTCNDEKQPEYIDEKRMEQLRKKFDVEDTQPDHALAVLGRQINRAKNGIVRGAKRAAEFFQKSS